MKKLTTAFLFAVLAYFSFVGVAVAQGVVGSEEPILDLAKPFYEAIMGGQFWLAAMFGLILATIVELSIFRKRCVEIHKNQ